MFTVVVLIDDQQKKILPEPINDRSKFISQTRNYKYKNTFFMANFGICFYRPPSTPVGGG